MDQVVRFPVKLDTPVQLEILQERVCRPENGVEVTLHVQVFTDLIYVPFNSSCTSVN